MSHRNGLKAMNIDNGNTVIETAQLEGTISNKVAENSNFRSKGGKYFESS